MAPSGIHLSVLSNLTTPQALRHRDTAIAEALRSTCHILRAEVATITILGKRAPTRHTLINNEVSVTRIDLPDHGGLHRSALLEGHAVIISDAGSDSRFQPEDEPGGLEVRNAIAIPIQLRLQNLGVLTCFNLPQETLETPATLLDLGLLSTCIGLALENCRLARTVRKVAITDDLTQVYNYRFLRSALRREMKRATRFRQAFTLLMVDVDHLKAYNDREGHLRGSRLLRDLARILSQQVRGMDLLAKYGGDEFTVILPQTPRIGGKAVAERICVAVAEHTFDLCTPGEMTVSIGLAMFPEDGIQATALIASSDAALFEAKQRGRNRVIEATGLILRNALSA